MLFEISTTAGVQLFIISINLKGSHWQIKQLPPSCLTFLFLIPSFSFLQLSDLISNDQGVGKEQKVGTFILITL